MLSLNRRGIRMAISALAVALAMATGCDSGSSNASPESSHKKRVVATTTMIGDLVTQIAGDRVDLTVIMPAGVDPHSFKPSTADVGRLGRADLVLYNGLHLEGKMVELLEKELSDRAVAVSRNVPQDQLLAWTQGQGGAHDPHIWFDVKIWTYAAKATGEALAKVDPTNASYYEQRAAELVADLEALDNEIRAKLATVARERRVLITSHDAYNYFGKTYDVEVRGIQGISTESEAGIADINNAVDFIVSRRIPAIFVESSVSHKSIERVQADCKARGMDVKIGGELYSDAMGAPGERPGYAVETYPGMVRYNVDTIVRALK